MKTKVELLEMLSIELALMAIKSNEASAGERQRLNQILGDLEYASPDTDELGTLKGELDYARDKADSLEKECAQLRAQIRELKTPPW